MKMDQLKFMKAHMAEMGNWKEVERINKMIAFNMTPTARAKARRATAARLAKRKRR